MMIKSHTSNKPLRYIAYVRKSEVREDRQELSHQSQIEEIKQRFPDLNIIKWMPSESASAFKPGRPIFNEMMDMIERGEADGIVGWHPNRCSRNEIDSARITYMLRDKLKDLKFVSYTFENSAEGIMFLQMTMNQSQYESSKQGRDVSRGSRTKASNGERPGVVPPGYMKVPVLDEHGQLIRRGKDKKIITETKPDPERFDLVKKMWRLVLSGEYNVSQVHKIARDEWKFVTRKTTKTGGKPLSTSMIYRMFSNQFYAGRIVHNGEDFKGNHEAMITLEEFDYVQKMLGDKGKPRKRGDVLAYSSIMVCGECGCSVVGEHKTKLVKKTGKMVTYVYYRCTRKSEARPCTQNIFTTLLDLEKQISDELNKYTILPEFRDQALKILRRSNKIEAKERTQVYASQQKRRAELQSQLDKLVDMRTRDLMDDDEYRVQSQRLKSERERVDEQLRGTENRAEEWMALTEKAFDFATYAHTKFKQTSDLAVKRDILLTLGTNLTLKDQKLTITPHEWLVPIEKDYPALEKRYLWARTNKKALSPEWEKAFVQIFETWRASGDLNPGHPA
jgi:site-specific DNA recombinase